jgi:hypothetical protein
MAAQRATEIRRLLAAVQADQAALRQRQDELERHLLAAPAATWPEVAEKARYLVTLFASTPEAQDPRRQRLISDLLEDLDRLSTAPDGGGASAISTEPGGPATGEEKEEQSMAKVQKRSSREPKKPKKSKPKAPTATVSPFARVQAKPAPSGSAPKK